MNHRNNRFKELYNMFLHSMIFKSNCLMCKMFDGVYMLAIRQVLYDYIIWFLVVVLCIQDYC